MEATRINADVAVGLVSHRPMTTVFIDCRLTRKGLREFGELGSSESDDLTFPHLSAPVRVSRPIDFKKHPPLFPALPSRSRTSDAL